MGKKDSIKNDIKNMQDVTVIYDNLLRFPFQSMNMYIIVTPLYNWQ